MSLVAKGSPISAVAERLLRVKDMPDHARRHCRELCKNGWTNRDVIWVVGSGELKEPRIRWGSRYPYAEEQLLLERRRSAVSPAKTAVLIEMPFGLLKKQFLGERTSGYGRWHSAVSPAKRLNRSRCHLGCGLPWAQGSICYMEVHIGSTWRIRLNCSCSGQPNEVSEMWPYVKLLWPYVGLFTVTLLLWRHELYFSRLTQYFMYF